MRRLLLFLLAAITPFVFADVEFTSPAAAGVIKAGAITVTWEESGIAPKISTLESYTLQLWVGGNTGTTSTSLYSITGKYGSANSAVLTVDPSLAANGLTNGFYLEMISTAKEGGTVQNYSPRFTLTGMTGTTSAVDTAAIKALAGSTAGPPTVNGVVAGGAVPNNPVVAPAASLPAGAAQWNVPYTAQTGPIRYAPMQPLPPTKITKNKATPLYPTSAYTTYSTWLPTATIVSTTTQAQTFSVHSAENTIAAQSSPTGDQAKFLARWKD